MTCILLCMPIQTLAMEYTIETMAIDAELQADGDVHVTEQQTYHFDGSFNGITRTLIPKEGTDIANVEAREGSDLLKVEEEKNTYRIYREGADETVTIKLTYTIRNGVAVYSDVAEFYWPFFDTGNESDYEQLDVTVQPPQSTDDVLALGYDVAEGTESIQNDGSVQFSMGSVAGGTNGDIRVAYDKDLFPSVSVTKDEPMRETIEAEQQKQIESQIDFENKQQTLRQVALYVLSIMVVGLIGLLLLARYKKVTVLREVTRQFSTPFFVPEERMSLPATIFYMKSGFLQSEALTAALLELIRKGYVKKTDDDAYEVINRNTTYEHEIHLIDWLFYKVGHDGIFKMNDLTVYTEDEANHATYQKDFTKWRQAVRTEEKNHRLFNRHIATRVISAAIGFLLIPFVIGLAIYELYLYMVLALILSGGFLLFGMLFKTRTVEGAKIKRDWQAFQDMYPDMNEEAWDELLTDDQKRAFIYSVGINDKQMNRKNDAMLEGFLDTNEPATNPMFFLMFGTMASSGFQSAHSTSSATTGSGSAGVGGGTGVGGGGGGSGAF